MIWLMSLLLLSMGFFVAGCRRNGPQHERLTPLARFFYFVGLPYLALLTGLLRAEWMGLVGLEHFTYAADLRYALFLMLLDWGRAAPLTLLGGGAACLLLAVIRREVDLRPALPATGLDTLYHSLHWAFYRAIFWALTGSLYLGVVLGVGPVLLEWGMCRRSAPQILSDSLILVLTAAIFFYSPNLWLLWPVHIIMVRIVEAQNLQQ